MNSIKLISLTIFMVLLSMSLTPGSDALLHAFKIAKFGTIGAIGTGAVLAPLGLPLVGLAGKGLLLKKAAIAGFKGGLLGASLAKPLVLAKSAVPAVAGFAPLLKVKKPVVTTPLPPPVVNPPPQVFVQAPVYQKAYVAPAPVVVKSYQQAYLPPPPPPTLLQPY